MRLVFLGTPEFAVPTLERIVDAGHQVAAVITQPDRPRGRGQQPAAPAVKQVALRLGLPLHQPERIRTPEFLAFLAGLKPEVMVVVGYGRIIPQSIIDVPPHGILNVHASLLPRYRGAAPIQWAIARGETRTGVTIMRIDAGLDTGDILLQRDTGIGPEETAPELASRLAVLGAGLLIEALDGIREGTASPRPQDHSQATLAPVLTKEDGRIDWTRTATDIHNRVRGFQPWPGAFTTLRGRQFQIWKARVAQEAAPALPRSLHPRGRRLLATCGGGTALELLEVQLEGKKRVSVEAFLHGLHLSENESFEA